MTGPTTTGSIDAKLTVDDSDFKRGMAEAKAEAKEVGALKPTVKVDANVGPALAKLEAVAKAERDLDIAFQRSAIAQEKLDTVTKKYGEDSLQAAVARLALTRATNAESDAQAKHSGLLQRDTVERDENTGATLRSVDANQRSIQGWQVLIGLAPVLLSSMAPIGAAAVGLAGSLTVMGVAGGVAIKGISDAMVVGDGVGNTYAAGLGSLKGNLDALAASSANAMLGSFNQVVGDINTRMPNLTAMIGSASGALGQMGGTALRGVLDGLQTMNPLIQAGQVELSKFVTWLFSFNGTNGFNQFIVYAIDNLPPVMHLIENLVITAGHILAAFAPLGPVVIGFLTGLTDGLNSLPLPVLAGLVTSAALLGPALRIAFSEAIAAQIGAVAAQIGFTGVMANLAVPVVGILTALIAGIGIAAATASLGTGQGTAALRDYTQAIKDDSLALGDHVKAQVAKELVDSGAAEAAQRLGLSLMTVQQAAIGNTTAIQAVKNVTDDAAKGIRTWADGSGWASEKNKQLSGDVDLMRGSVIGASGAVEDQLNKQKILNEMLHPTTEAMGAQSTAAGILAGQYGVTVASIQAAQDAESKTAQATADATLKMQLQNDAAGLLKMTLDGLNGKAISAAQAQNSFDSSLVNMGDHVSATGKKIHFTTTSIEDMSSASVALRGQLNTQVTGLQAVVEANGGLDESTGKAKAQMEAMRTQIIENAVAHGVDRDAVTAYVDNLLTIPKSIPPTKIDVDTAAAIANIESFKGHLASIQDRLVTVTERTLKDPGGMGSSIGGRENGSLAGGAATGGLIHAGFSATSPAYLAGGGSPFVPRGVDTVPAMLAPGEIIMSRASVDSLGSGNLLHANRTGQWPGQQQGQAGGPVTVNLILDGQIIDTRIVDLAATAAQDALDNTSRMAGGKR